MCVWVQVCRAKQWKIWNSRFLRCRSGRYIYAVHVCALAFFAHVLEHFANGVWCSLWRLHLIHRTDHYYITYLCHVAGALFFLLAILSFECTFPKRQIFFHFKAIRMPTFINWNSERRKKSKSIKTSMWERCHTNWMLHIHELCMHFFFFNI